MTCQEASPPVERQFSNENIKDHHTIGSVKASRTSAQFTLLPDSDSPA